MEKETLTMPVQLTSGAINEVKEIRKSQNIQDNLALRLGVKSGGCSGFSYVIGFDEPTEQDEVYTFEGLQITIEKSHLVYLEGITVDFENGLSNRGFTFDNPNAKESCGCGTSFSA